MVSRKNARQFMVVIVIVFTGVLLPSSAHAECARPAATLGTATSQLNTAAAGTFAIWSRLRAPNATANSFYLIIDTDCPITVGDSAIAAGSWSWIDYQLATPANKITVALTAGNHTLTLIGRESGVQVDRILAIQDSCVPTGLGDNCVSSTDASPTPSSVSITPVATSTTTAATSRQQVTGNVFLQPAPVSTVDDEVTVTKVEYYVDGTYISTVTTSPFKFILDTKKLSNGSHTVALKTYYSDGQVKQTTQRLTVRNASVVQTAVASSRARVGAGLLLTLIPVGFWLLIYCRRHIIHQPGVTSLALATAQVTADQSTPSATNAPEKPFDSGSYVPTVITPTQSPNNRKPR